ncbi:hypothetical protein L6452_06221 [Arctium lappa]|uniref:Uncharacterized protein n=1 Tax=Arctium lappa TaxID=4217 RepID=A0ACB9EJL6_ARCLA|nr:hypothetical protein L6452_06221 [Arctium lappa]
MAILFFQRYVDERLPNGSENFCFNEQCNRSSAQKNLSHTTFLDRGESGLHFVKYHGLGNDFIMVNNLDSMDPIVTLEQAVKLCDRNFGIGGDGIIFAMPGSNGTDYTMRIFNSDGSEPEKQYRSRFS